MTEIAAESFYGYQLTKLVWLVPLTAKMEVMDSIATHD